MERKKLIRVVVLIAVYALVFFVGFRMGAAYLRMQQQTVVEVIQMPDYSPFYVIEQLDRGGYSEVDFRVAGKNDPVIQIFQNEKLRHLLKRRKIEIYKADGERVY